MQLNTKALLSIIFLFSSAASAGVYNCTTEFGESVPLQLTALRAGKPLADLSRTWNSAVKKDESLTSKIKSEEFTSGNEKLTFEWRYAKRPGPPFSIDVQCPAVGKCSGTFVGAKSTSELMLETKLFDQRFTPQRGYVQLNLGNREELALRIRVTKEMGAPDSATTQTLSGSGEHMILRLEPRFIIDVGVDEHLKLSGEHEHRLAALEIKVRCQLNN